MTAAHRTLTPSAWVRRWSHLVPPSGTVLDVACGSGRHVRWFADRACRVTGVDRDAGALQPLSAIAEVVVADIENGRWPLGGRRFDAVVVTHYLWRPLLPTILDSVVDGGVLIWETFSAGNETVGKPSSPQFLLRTGELLHMVKGLRVVAFEEGYDDRPPRYMQRIVAVRERTGAALSERYRLSGGAGPTGQVKSADSEELP